MSYLSWKLVFTTFFWLIMMTSGLSRGFRSEALLPTPEEPCCCFFARLFCFGDSKIYLGIVSPKFLGGIKSVMFTSSFLGFI